MLTVRVTPKASRNAIQGTMATPDGLALKIAVTAPADKGKANAAVIALLAEAFGIAKRNIDLTAGETDRRKLLRISGDPAALTRTAQKWMTP
jgi:uncharacterized protein